VTDSARSGLRPIPLARPPEFVVCPIMRESGQFVTSGREAAGLAFKTICSMAAIAPPTLPKRTHVENGSSVLRPGSIAP
jgi:hypothetical protein